MFLRIEDLLTAAECARRFNITVEEIEAGVKSGELPGPRFTADEIAKFKKNRQQESKTE